MKQRTFPSCRSLSPLRIVLCLTCALAAGIAAPPGSGQSAKPVPKSGATGRFASAALQRRAMMYFQTVWGIDSLEVKYTEAGEMIRFSYRVVDSKRAAALGDKKSEPHLIDPQAGVRLSIPEVQNVGKLRQSSAPEAGKSYWMAFSNKGRLVKPGHRVDVQIGNFNAQGLLVN